MSGRVLVTGGAGFIGSRVAEEYLRNGWEVTVLDDLSRGKREQVPQAARFVQADIRSPEGRDTVLQGRFDVINHQAAQVDVRVSVERPVFDAEINLLGLVNLLDAAGRSGVRRFVFASSGGVVYGDPQEIPTPEHAVKGPISPYGVSKLAGEHYLRALAALHGFEGVALRYSNVFGSRQDPQSEAGVVSIFISRLLAGQKLTVYGDGKQTRDYVFVGDVARANLAAATAAVPRGDDIDSTAFNIATSVQLTVLDLAHACGRVLGVRPEIEFAPARPGELLRNALNIGKAKRGLGWVPQASFEDGLREVVTWFKQETR